MKKANVLEFIETNKRVFTDVSDEIWGYAELAFNEYKSMEALCKILEDYEFEVKTGIAKIPTAFKASYGTGKPIIGILGEYDALSSLSQVAFSSTQQPLEKIGDGHGCGHNMLGSGSLAAAVAMKEFLKENQVEGTVVYFGCPAEEGGSGKAFMAREGVFDNLDAALTWHPSSINATVGVSMLANYQVDYHFKGIASHAAAAPHRGRSALDAVELMNVGANYLREHIIQEARLHYAMLDSGGTAPNVVQPHATVTYLVRAPKNHQVQEIYERLNMVAKGAAMMTQTEVSIDFSKACSNLVNNRTLEKLMQQNLVEIGTPEYTEDEIEFAKIMNQTVVTKTDGMMFPAPKEYLKKISEQQIVSEILPYYPLNIALPGSSDVGDVSWNTPTAQIVTACYSKNTPEHSWQLVSQGKSTIAHKGLITAAKVMAATAVDLFQNQELLESARKDFEEERDGEKYVCAIPPEKAADIMRNRHN